MDDIQTGVADVGRGRDVGSRRRRVAAAVFGLAGGALAVWGALAVADAGFDRPGVAVSLGLALVAANLAPVVALSGGRIDALTPVGALLVPIGVLLPLPEAVIVYAVGEALGVVAGHRLDRHVGGPSEAAAVRTTFVIGKSIVGAAAGLLALQAVLRADDSLPFVVLASLAGVGVSTALDRAMASGLAALVQRSSLLVELRRGLAQLTFVAASEVVIGALIAILADRDAWSLVLGLAAFGLLLLVGSAYARAAAERGHTAELLGLARQLHQAETSDAVLDALLAVVRRLLPEDDLAVTSLPPDPRHRSWRIGDDAAGPRWLVTPRLLETRDFDQQPRAIVEAAVSLASMALGRVAVQEQLVEQDRLRALVLATVAHDLRSPLAIANGGVEVLVDRGGRLSDEERGELVALTGRAIGRMQRLVDDVLDLELAEERSQQGGAGVDARAVATRLAADAEPDAVPVLVEDGPPVPARIDGVSLERVLDNVLGNARRHSPAGSPVVVRFVDEPGRVTIVVEDRGPGVPPEDREHIFEPFRHGRGQQGSVGLGLYVARRFVELHGGRIWVEDALGGGAAFHASLPSAEQLVTAEPPTFAGDVTPVP